MFFTSLIKEYEAMVETSKQQVSVSLTEKFCDKCVELYYKLQNTCRETDLIRSVIVGISITSIFFIMLGAIKLQSLLSPLQKPPVKVPETIPPFMHIPSFLIVPANRSMNL